jgi:hypothetical protein
VKKKSTQQGKEVQNPRKQEEKQNLEERACQIQEQISPSSSSSSSSAMSSNTKEKC